MTEEKNNWLSNLFSALFKPKEIDKQVVCKEWIEKNGNLTRQLEDVHTTLNNTILLLDDKDHKINVLTEQIPQEHPLEVYWNTKRKKVNRKYPARPAFGGSDRINVDPRVFFTNNHNLPKVGGATHDEKAMNGLKYVVEKVKYVSDPTQFKEPEVWLFSHETLKLCQGDCEDSGILIANILINSGIPYWRIRLNVGDVKGGKHCYTTYLRESDNNWYILDAAYWPSESLKWKSFHDAEKYFDIDFSWNKKYIFGDERLDRD